MKLTNKKTLLKSKLSLRTNRGPKKRNDAFVHRTPDGGEPLLPAIGGCARIGLLSAKIYFRKSGSKAEKR